MISQNKKILEEPAYYVQVYYNAYFDDFCFKTLYRFMTKQLAQDFCEQLNNIINIKYNPYIFFEIKKSLFGSYNQPTYRFVFNNLNIALNELNYFMSYCDSYFYKQPQHKYKNNIFIVNSKEYNSICFKNEFLNL